MALENLIAFVLPAYFANAAPVVARGRTVVDLGRRLPDGRRVFGDGKTYKGLAAGIIVGTFLGVLLAMSSDAFLPGFSFQDKVTIGFLLSIGTMAGDLAGSFIKRRIGIQSGSQHEFFDQLLFLGGALLLASPYYLPQLWEIAFLVAITYVLHKLFNMIAHALKLKKVPW